MSRCLPIHGIAVLASVLALAPIGAGAPRELSILAAAYDSPREAGIGPVQLSEVGGVVIRGPKELVALSTKAGSVKDAAVRAELEAELAKALGLESIDWSKQMVLAIRGESGTRLDRVHVESLKLDGKTLTVNWKVKQRPPHAGPGLPLALLLVERVDEVKFVEAGR